MRQTKRQLKEVITIALRARQSASYQPWNAICVYDAADKLGIEVRFIDVPSMEGIYLNQTPPVILVSSLRPPGRQAFTCAHELGHHFLNHGDRIDKAIAQLFTEHRDNNEYFSDLFAGFFLMPKTAVSRAFAIRGWETKSVTSLHIYKVACWLGVGYSTLIQHMHFSLNILSGSQTKKLLRTNPKRIRKILLGDEFSGNLIIVDTKWSNCAIDIQVGDFVLLPNSSKYEGDCVRFIQEDKQGKLIRGEAPGKGRLWLDSSNWAAYVRVSRNGFVGRSIYRHLEEPEDD